MLKHIDPHAYFLVLNALNYSYRTAKKKHTIIDSLSLSIGQQERVGLVGESGSGKSTLLKLILGLAAPQTGQIHCAGMPIIHSPWQTLKNYRRLVQYIPQDPHTALPPTQTVAKLLAEPLKRLAVGKPCQAALERAVKQVELPVSILYKKAGELSGGQAQRIALARALIIQPKFLLADEPTSGLDLPLREQIKSLLKRVCHENQMGLLVVTHDISLVSDLCERMLVMHQGQIIEDGATGEVIASPVHLYSQKLIEAVPRIDFHHLHDQSSSHTV